MKEGNENVDVIKIYGISRLYKEKGFLATLPTDVKGKRFLTGQEHLTAAERNTLATVFPVSPDEHYFIQNGDELRLEKHTNGPKSGEYKLTKDYALYLLYSVLSEVANSIDDINPGTSLFYMTDINKEAKKVSDGYRLKSKAFAKLEDKTTLEDLTNMLFYFGENGYTFSLNTAESRVFEIANNNPSKVLEYFADLEQSNKIVFVRKLIEKDILKRHSVTNDFVYNEVTIGETVEEAAQYIYSNKNDSVYKALSKALEH